MRAQGDSRSLLGCSAATDLMYRGKAAHPPSSAMTQRPPAWRSSSSCAPAPPPHHNCHLTSIHNICDCITLASRPGVGTEPRGSVLSARQSAVMCKTGGTGGRRQMKRCGVRTVRRPGAVAAGDAHAQVRGGRCEMRGAHGEAGEAVRRDAAAAQGVALRRVEAGGHQHQVRRKGGGHGAQHQRPRRQIVTVPRPSPLPRHLRRHDPHPSDWRCRPTTARMQHRPPDDLRAPTTQPSAVRCQRGNLHPTDPGDYMPGCGF